MDRRSVFFLPWQGEFGIYISTFVRAVHTWLAEDKIVACPAGECCLFPTASSFYHDFEELVPDRKRVGRKETPWVKDKLERLQERICQEHPQYRDYEFVMPFMKYDCFRSPQQIIKACFAPKIVSRGLEVDVVLTPRKRSFHTERNLAFWQEILNGLKDRGLSIGAVGRKDTSFHLTGIDINSWDYDGIDACIEMMQNAKIILAQNCGLAHLAIFLRTPMIMMRTGNGMICWMEQQRDNAAFFKIVEPECRIAIQETLSYLACK